MQLARYTKPESLISELDKVFHSAFFNSFDRFFEKTTDGHRIPVAYSTEDKDNIYLKVELPGIKKEDVNIEYNNNILTIKANSIVKEKRGKESIESEYHFERSLELPNIVSIDKVNASLENGLLTVTLPKSEERKPRQIMIS